MLKKILLLMYLLKIIASKLFYHLAIIHAGGTIAKFKSLTILTLYSSLPSYFFLTLLGMESVINDWLADNGGYLFFVLLAIGIDHFLGSWVHAFIKRDFSIKKNFTGILVKIALVFSAGLLFEGFQFIYTEENIITEYLTIVTRLMVFLYPAGSAFMNCAIITNGKFPSTALLKNISRFNNSLNVKDLKGNEDDK